MAMIQLYSASAYRLRYVSFINALPRGSTLEKVLSKKSDSVLPIYIKGSIEQSLRSVFGEIGGQTTVDILKFDRKTCRGIIRIPEKYYVKTRAAITLISKFQEITCHFKVNATSPVLFSLMESCLFN